MGAISKRVVKGVAVVVTAPLIFSCGAAVFDPTAFNPDTGAVETIPPVCKPAYEAAIPRVAVVNFTNNTTFEYAKVVQQNITGAGQRTTVGGAAVGVAPGAAGIVWGQKEQTQFQMDAQKIEREFNAKLSESVEDSVTNEIVNMGGAKIFTRNELKKVLEEQKFQMSGLADDRTLVQLGKLAGVKYIVTGSVNNVDLKWVSLEEVRGAAKRVVGGLVGAAIAIAAEQQEGWNISADITLRIIDVETGEIVFSKIANGKHIIGKTPYPNYDTLIGGIKQASSKAVADLRPELSKWFTLRGYILQTRTSPDGKQRAALVSIGQKMGIKQNDQLFVMTFQEVKDPFTNKVSCDIVKLPLKLVVTNQVQEDKAWAIIEGEPNQIARVKTGQLVERVPLKGAGILEKLGK